MPSGGCCGCQQGPCGDPAEPGWAAEMGRTEMAPRGGGKAARACVSFFPSRQCSGAASPASVVYPGGLCKQEPRACSKLQEHSGTHQAPSCEGSGWVSVSLSWERPSVLGGVPPPPKCPGAAMPCVSSHITGPSWWLPWPVIAEINNHNNSPCASLGK